MNNLPQATTTHPTTATRGSARVDVAPSTCVPSRRRGFFVLMVVGVTLLWVGSQTPWVMEGLFVLALSLWLLGALAASTVLPVVIAVSIAWRVERPNRPVLGRWLALGESIRRMK